MHGFVLLLAAFAAHAADAPADLTRARRLLAEGKPREAVQVAAEYRKRVPDDLAGYEVLARAQLGVNDVAGAEDSVDWMFRLRPPTPESLELGALVRQRLGDREGALQFVAQAAQALAPERKWDRARLLLLAASLESEAGRWLNAERYLHEAAQLAPDDPAVPIARKRLETARQPQTDKP